MIIRIHKHNNMNTSYFLFPLLEMEGGKEYRIHTNTKKTSM
jgi:hypothetical protein